MLAGCAPQPARDSRAGARALPDVALFSPTPAGAALPPDWEKWILDPRKPPTRYTLEREDGRPVIHAVAVASVSALARKVLLDPRAYPLVRWRWKAERLIPHADELHAPRDDSPARLMIAFSGEPGRLDPAERAKLSLASALSKRDMPYATLMYIWSNEQPPGTLIANPRSSRVQMIVVERGAANLGRWMRYERDVVADYRRAFGEEPGLITLVGLMSDADDTGASASTYYGDIGFAPVSALPLHLERGR